MTDLPRFLRARLIDLERSHSGPIPAHRRSDAMMPRNGDSMEEIAEAIAYYEEQVRSNWLKCDAAEQNLMHGERTGTPRDVRWYEQQRDAAKNLLAKSIRYRDAWVEAAHVGRVQEAAE